MSEARQITARQREILTAIVENYIATGEPVGSGTLARELATRAAVSSATVRSEMAGLSEAGLLEQPHTSAGRVPSAQAFRLYVEDLRERPFKEPALPGESTRLQSFSRSELADQIDSRFSGLAGQRALLERTSHVLATFSSGVGVALSAVPAGDLLEHVHFSRLAERRVLAVLVTHGGTVRDRVLSLEQDRSASELESAANYLNDHFRGWTVERVRAELARRIEADRDEYQRLRDAAEELWSRTVPAEDAGSSQSLYVDGVANLVGAREDRGRLREMLAALEAKGRIVELLNAYIDTRQESVRVVFDLEAQAPEMAGMVLIAAPARMAGQPVGTVGVIGPQRMHYQNALNAVAYIAGLLERIAEPRHP